MMSDNYQHDMQRASGKLTDLKRMLEERAQAQKKGDSTAKVSTTLYSLTQSMCA